MHAAQRLMGVGCALFIVLTASVPAPAVAETWRVKVRGNGTDLGETPIVVALKQPLP